MKITQISQLQSQQHLNQMSLNNEPARSFDDYVTAVETKKDNIQSNDATQTPLAKKVREASEQLVASAFVLPILQKMQDDPFRSDMFHGGSGEDMFAQQWNTHVADDIVKRANFPMVDAVYNQIMRQANPSVTAHAASQKAVDTHA